MSEIFFTRGAERTLRSLKSDQLPILVNALHRLGHDEYSLKIRPARQVLNLPRRFDVGLLEFIAGEWRVFFFVDTSESPKRIVIVSIQRVGEEPSEEIDEILDTVLTEVSAASNNVPSKDDPVAEAVHRAMQATYNSSR